MSGPSADRRENRVRAAMAASAAWIVAMPILRQVRRLLRGPYDGGVRPRFPTMVGQGAGRLKAARASLTR
ncbi:hypothetical protein STVA_21430 [Allostella vacuolata]|nr:hypothetical protein STVA_21430 [Stella vacuolata]